MMKNLLSMARGFALHLHSRVMFMSPAEVRSGLSFSELPLFVRLPKAITKGITY